MVGASILFFFGTSDIRSLTQVAPAAAKSRKAAPQDPGQAPTQPAPYDHDLQRLSEILGALHFLRGICNSKEGPKWRNEAQALIDAEAPSGKRHDDMVASFNRGYLSFQSYRTCTSVADVVIRHYLEEGAKIARDITARYANQRREYTPTFYRSKQMFLRKAELVDTLSRDLARARNKRDTFAARVTTLTAQIAELEVRLSTENERLERERAALEIVAIKKRVRDRCLAFSAAVAGIRNATEAAETNVPETRELTELLDVVATGVAKAIDGLLSELDLRIEAVRAGNAAQELQQWLTWCPESPQISDRLHRLPLKLTKEEATQDRTAA